MSETELTEAVREELESLWGDLEIARRSAIRPGAWTIQCESLEERIKRLTKLVGPTPWQSIQIALMELGIYQRIHADLGIEVAPDMERVAEIRAKITESVASIS